MEYYTVGEQIIGRAFIKIISLQVSKLVIYLVLLIYVKTFNIPSTLEKYKTMHFEIK